MGLLKSPEPARRAVRNPVVRGFWGSQGFRGLRVLGFRGCVGFSGLLGASGFKGFRGFWGFRWFLGGVLGVWVVLSRISEAEGFGRALM